MPQKMPGSAAGQESAAPPPALPPAARLGLSRSGLTHAAAR